MNMKRVGVIGWIGILAITLFALAGCGGGGGGSSNGSQPNTFSPTLGAWSGDNISFTLNPGSIVVNDLYVAYSGQYRNCQGITITYEANQTIDANIQVIDNAFSYESPDFQGANTDKLNIIGKFTSATTAEFEVSWSIYDSVCLTWHQGSATFYASHESAVSYSINNPYIQYRTFEDPSSNTYRIWLELTKNNAAIDGTDLSEIFMTDSSGNRPDPIELGFIRYKNMLYDCSATPCNTSGPFDTSGVWAAFDNLPADTYKFEANTADGESATRTVVYPGRLELPVVSNSTMTSIWSNNDLELSWANPSNDANWNEVDELRIVVYDENGVDVLYIKTQPATEQVTIPESLLNQAAGLGSGALAAWEVQTRSYDQNEMNFARGVSNRIELSNPVNYSIKNAYMQYRNYGDPAQNRYAAWIEVTKDGLPAQSTDVVGFTITGPDGNVVSPTSWNFYQSEYYYYDCSSAPCNAPQLVSENGYAANFSNISAGTYIYEVEASDGQKVSKPIDYPGQLILPTVESDSMNISILANGDWQLNWANPTSVANWNEVDQLRIILMAADYTELLYVRANPSTTTVTIPASLINQAETLGGGTLDWWQIQTRAYDQNNMMYSRGYSN